MRTVRFHNGREADHLAKRGCRAGLHGLGGALLSDGVDLIDAD
jgi:hypothetical protein